MPSCFVTVAQVLALPPHSKKVMGSIPAWGAGPPQSAQCSGGLSPGPLCVEFPCSRRVHKGFPPLRTPTEKTCKKMDSSLHLVPGRYKLPTAPGGSLRKDGPGWEKAENKFTATSGLPVCVLCRLCRVCAVSRSCNI